jgi:glycosyltransferase involved in cell wall biosynthesis
MKHILSVIICTHNPRLDYLFRVLKSLQVQTLSRDLWELCLIDNASDDDLSSNINLSWHPLSQCFRENKLGLTNARLRGIQEANGEILVFLDDDNVLDHDYLENVLQISKDYPFIGAWSGRIIPEFEIKPPEWTKQYWGMLAIRDFDQDRWSNVPYQKETTPYGAGLCIRKFIAEKYAESLDTQTYRKNLDRQGKRLVSGGDLDLAFTACEFGLGTGLFTSLKLTHLIPAFRLELDYIEKLAEGMAYSRIILNSVRGLPVKRLNWRGKIGHYYSKWKLSPIDRRIYDARQRGVDLAIKELNEKNY